MSEAAISGLKVAITCSRKQYLTQNESTSIFQNIQQKIISDAYSAQHRTDRPTGPSFNGEPLFEDGAIKLWCDNGHTLAWLKDTIRKIPFSSYPSLEVKSQSEIQKRTPGTFTITDQQHAIRQNDITQTLRYQNPGLDFNRLEVTVASNKDYVWTVTIMFPEDQKHALEKAGCKLAIGLRKVDVKFDK